MHCGVFHQNAYACRDSIPRRTTRARLPLSNANAIKRPPPPTPSPPPLLLPLPLSPPRSNPARPLTGPLKPPRPARRRRRRGRTSKPGRAFSAAAAATPFRSLDIRIRYTADTLIPIVRYIFIKNKDIENVCSPLQMHVPGLGNSMDFCVYQ